MANDRSFFCSDLSRLEKESIYGTASRGQVWVILEYPKPWSALALQDSTLTTELKEYLGLMLASIHGRLLFIQKESSHERGIALFIAFSREKDSLLYSFVLDSYDDLFGIDLQGILSGMSQHRPLDSSQSLYLVCTDGQHDKCCAKYGFSIYQSLLNFDPTATWQSSHVGGDRFAPNLVCFPHGIFYGHITREDISSIHDDYSHRRIRVTNYRGRSCFPFPIQAAEYFVRLESGVLGLDMLFFKQSSRLSRSKWQVEFESGMGHTVYAVEFAATKSNFRNYLRCNSAERESVIQYQLINYTESRGKENPPV